MVRDLVHATAENLGVEDQVTRGNSGACQADRGII